MTETQRFSSAQRETQLLEYFEARVGAPIQSSHSLFDSGLLDSMSLVELLGFLESEFHISIAPSEVRIENLDTILRIVQFLGKKGVSSHA